MARDFEPVGVVRDVRPTPGHTLRTLAAWGLVWLLPIVAVMAVFGSGHVLARQSIFFSKAAVVSFGGAYAMLAYVAQQAVETYELAASGRNA